MSLESALTTAGLSAAHLHVLNPAILAVRQKRRAEAGLQPTLQHQEAARLAPMIADLGTGLRIVSAVRDPLAQQLSAVFQRWNDFPPSAGVDRSDPTAVAQWFIDTCDPAQTATWFEDEFEAVLGIDIYATPFDRVTRSLRFRRGRFDIVILRCEDTNEIKQAALNDWLGRTDLKLFNENQASKKPQAELYAEVKKRARLPRLAVDRFLDIRWVRHFYSPDEIKGLRKLWTR